MAPRPPSVALAALTLLALALAGCTAPPPAAEPGPSEDTVEPQGGLLPTAEVANATQGDEGQGEFAQALEERFHTHNYWGGAMEKLLLDEDVASGPLVPFDANNPLFSAFTALFRLGFGGAGFTEVVLPDGSIVPPESERVEVQVTWADSPTITGLRLVWMTAASKDLEFSDPFPAGGGTVAIPTNLTTSDMPHSSVSKWRFFLAPDSEDGPGLFNGTAHVIIKAFRNDTLYLAPPHPDWWGDETQKLLLEANGTLSCTRVVFPLFIGVPGATAGCEAGFVELELPNGTIVPPHTAVLTIEMTWTNEAATDPFTTRPDVFYTPANTRRGFPPEGQLVEAGHAVFTIPVTPRMVDSPYANQTEWGFFVFLRSDAPTDSGFFGGLGGFEGPYTARITVERESL